MIIMDWMEVTVDRAGVGNPENQQRMIKGESKSVDGDYLKLSQGIYRVVIGL
jgi:hypothetical protein